MMEKYRSGDNSGLIANNLEQSLPMGGRLEPTHSLQTLPSLSDSSLPIAAIFSLQADPPALTCTSSPDLHQPTLLTRSHHLPAPAAPLTRLLCPIGARLQLSSSKDCSASDSHMNTLHTGQNRQQRGLQDPVPSLLSRPTSESPGQPRSCLVKYRHPQH